MKTTYWKEQPFSDRTVSTVKDSYEEFEEYQSLYRPVKDQTITTDGRIEVKPDKEISPTSMQNPSDPTYRNKAGKSHTGYVGNFVKTVGGKVSLIDAYASVENTKLAEEKNMELVTTCLTRKNTNNDLKKGGHLMTIEEILAGESKTVEFKRELPDKSEKYMKSVVAFSNTSGGKIIIGVEDKTRTVVGVPDDKAFEIIDSITNAISDSCSPQIIPDTTLQTIKDKTVVVVSIYPGRQRPYYITSLGKENGIFIRTSGSSRRADSAQIKELEFEGANRYFDQTYSVGHTVSEGQISQLCADMKTWALKACKTEQEKKNVKEVTKGNLISWGLLTERDGALFPTNAFLLLTDNDFPQAKIQCAVFKGTTRNIFIDKREYTGPIQDQIEEAYQFVLRNIRLGATIRGLYRVDDYELPIEGIRELICNAVAHRSYLDEGCVQVTLFDDRLEVTSPGMLFGGLSIEDLKEGQSRPRNRGIASAFVAMKVIEQWGTGIPRIIEMCKEYEFQEPEFIEIGMDFRVNLYRKHNTDKNENQLIGDENQLIGVDNQLNEDGKPLIQRKNQLIEKVNQLIDMMDGNANTKENIRLLYKKLEDDQVFGRKDIMGITGLSINPAGTLIHKLLDMNLIVPVKGKGKGKYIFSIKI